MVTPNGSAIRGLGSASKRVSKLDGHWLWIGGPVPPGSVGITVGPLVVVRKAAARSEGFSELLAHEQVHVRQFAELGFVRFMTRYLVSYARFRLRGYGHRQAYLRIPLEVEARVDSRSPVASAPADVRSGTVSDPASNSVDASAA